MKSSGTPLTLELTVADPDLSDLVDLEWSGSTEHLKSLAEAMGRREADEVELVMIKVGNGLSVAVGAVDFSKRDDAGELWMLSVREDWQSLGVGTIMIGALEARIAARGRPYATLGVEHDNPRAAALYRRLGYRETGTALDDWSVGPDLRYVTVCLTMIKSLRPSSDPVRV